MAILEAFRAVELCMDLQDKVTLVILLLWLGIFACVLWQLLRAYFLCVALPAFSGRPRARTVTRVTGKVDVHVDATVGKPGSAVGIEPR